MTLSSIQWSNLFQILNAVLKENIGTLTNIGTMEMGSLWESKIYLKKTTSLVSWKYVLKEL